MRFGIGFKSTTFKKFRAGIISGPMVSEMWISFLQCRYSVSTPFVIRLVRPTSKTSTSALHYTALLSCTGLRTYMHCTSHRTAPHRSAGLR